MTTICAPKSSLSLLIVLCITTLLSGCQKEEDRDPGTFCAGGFIRTDAGADPVCEGLCQPSLCQHANNVCVDNNCTLQCATHADCAVGQDCAPATEDGTGASIMICRANGKAAVGKACPSGNECEDLKTCNDGSPCAADGDCKSGHCEALTCRTAGVDDVNAYCTMFDCHSDGDCPGGFTCRTVRVADQICGAPATSCGTSTGACVDPSQNESNGTTYANGEFCAQRNQCRVRAQCDPCTTDLDCSLVAGQRCVNGGCATQCGSDADCRNGFECTSGACVPRSGSCASPTGQGQLCDACRSDAECGAGLLCTSVNYGGMRVCLLQARIPCGSEADCPVTRAGVHAACDPSVSDQCLPGPYYAALNLTACSCQNEGASCSAPTDCCSGQCGDVDDTGLGVCQ